MSPTRVANAVDLDQQLHVLVKALDSLLLSFHELSIKEQALEKRVKYAHDEVSAPPQLSKVGISFVVILFKAGLE
jgi:hypothetical protein